MKKLYVDDVRPVPDFSWTPAFNYTEAMHMLRTTDYDEISLDHDIASYDDVGIEKTGYNILCYLERRRIQYNEKIPYIYIHTSNAAMFKKMSYVAKALNDLGKPHEAPF